MRAGKLVSMVSRHLQSQEPLFLVEFCTLHMQVFRELVTGLWMLLDCVPCQC